MTRGRPKGSKPKVNIRVKKNRPDISTKEELISYINNSGGLELPFLEELWDRCVILAERDKKNGRKTASVVTTNADGTQTVQNKFTGFWSENPVVHYYKQCGLPNWRKKATELIDTSVELSQDQQKILSASFNDVSENETYSDEVLDWINLFSPQEKVFLKKRYAHYYDCYDINEGADKVSLKRLLSLEIACNRIDLKRALGQNINIPEEDRLTEQLRKTLESLKWTKKQRNAREEMAQNKFTVWITEQSKSEHFTPKKVKYPKDEIDYLLDTYINSAKEIMS
jgi:hypothetical protein